MLPWIIQSSSVMHACARQANLGDIARMEVDEHHILLYLSCHFSMYPTFTYIRTCHNSVVT
jgi:hypothetical protein